MKLPERFQTVDEPIFTPGELAKLTKFHVSTIRKLFTDEAGVLRLGHAGLGRKRQYFTLRIPASVAARVFERMTVSTGARVTNPFDEYPGFDATDTATQKRTSVTNARDVRQAGHEAYSYEKR